jgi:DNA replication protein DnaC
MRTMLLELMERRYGETSTAFWTQYSRKDWHQWLGSGVHADAVMDRILHNTIWVETGSYDMREHTALVTA